MEIRRSRGQSAVEFALVLPIFLLLVVGMIDLGRGVAAHALLANAAREGARAAIFPQTDDATIVAAVNSQSLLLGTIPSGSVTITPSIQSARTSGLAISVRVDYTYIPMVAAMLTNTQGGVWTRASIPMTSTSTMLIE